LTTTPPTLFSASTRSYAARYFHTILDHDKRFPFLGSVVLDWESHPTDCSDISPSQDPETNLFNVQTVKYTNYDVQMHQHNHGESPTKCAGFSAHRSPAAIGFVIGSA
jgi:hypothetical protein